jgi:hypothetical protein
MLTVVCVCVGGWVSGCVRVCNLDNCSHITGSIYKFNSCINDHFMFIILPVVVQFSTFLFCKLSSRLAGKVVIDSS